MVRSFAPFCFLLFSSLATPLCALLLTTRRAAVATGFGLSSVGAVQSTYATPEATDCLTCKLKSDMRAS